MALLESDIQSLLMERKRAPENWHTLIKLQSKVKHFQLQLNVTGEHGNPFLLILRKNVLNKLDFSVIVATQLENPNRIFRLRRYNGCSHIHSNRLESETFFDFIFTLLVNAIRN